MDSSKFIIVHLKDAEKNIEYKTELKKLRSLGFGTKLISEQELEPIKKDNVRNKYPKTLPFLAYLIK
uniref:Uncharacterized protein n=1 Tax=viral metagenome TaxID=1070528 RepID=A0A6H1ZMH3_9ZZZZ